MVYASTPKFTVESGPELTASEVYSQKCWEKKSKEACDLVDVYSETTKSFGSADGVSDCQWISL
jgi:hypothetical protein